MVSKMEWEDIDNLFKNYERLCRKPPTTEELIDMFVRTIEETRDLFKEYKVNGNGTRKI